jgi:hypothetical protein
VQRTWLPSMRSTASRKKKQTAAGDTGITSLTHEELIQRVFLLGFLKKYAAEFEIHRPGGALLKLALQSPTMASLQSQCQVQITRLAYVWLFDSPCFRTSQQPRARFNAFLSGSGFSTTASDSSKLLHQSYRDAATLLPCLLPAGRDRPARRLGWARHILRLGACAEPPVKARGSSSTSCDQPVEKASYKF